MTPRLDVQAWQCVHALCTAEARTCDDAIPHHRCPYAGGLLIPLVRVGESEMVRLVERQDYIGDEDVPLTEGRPVMAAERIRDDGMDTTVYAPTARATAEDLEAVRDAHD